MKFVATFLVAVFIVTASASFAFADCAAHNKAQLVKNQGPEQISKDQSASTSTAFTVAEKAAESGKTASKIPDKK